ncbi:hypothetical protein [Sphingomonas solaris]|uniref:Glycosyl transferase n=1 Tax=Alterirhizorhabdus solaris TaxID=2529389 RepID=A0A558QYT0_9SPHN|nr:hypothetical protein [Sphingomonas solaris]TVV72311.1 hypothetical protein FOY91_14905 [Sphingomonas solaris]
MSRTIEADVAFLFIGGAHQVFHLAPVAAALSREQPDLVVTCICADEETEAALVQVRAAMATERLRIAQVTPPPLTMLAARLFGRRAAGKGPLLAKLALRLRHARAIVVPERTSAALRWLGWRRLLIHFRHGAGDRAPKSEKRLKAFDLIVVPGEKDVARAIEVQRVAPERVRSCGYVKLDYIAQTAADRPARLFGDDRPVVLYNPHFDAAISSLGQAQAVLAAFAAQDRYNLVFAPHVRASEDMDEAEIAAWQALAVPGRIIVDLRSPRLIDMTYLRAADIYLGDMSSQLYEFIARPRPVAFLNTHGVAWQNDPRHAGWHLGAVTDDPADVVAAVDRAVATHPSRIAAQAAAVARSFGDPAGASLRGARIVADAIAA